MISLQEYSSYGRDRWQTVDSTSTFDRNPTYGGGNGEEADNGSGVAESALIYFITPTYPRREQVAELIRLGQTLMHVPRLYWIVADDRPDCSPQIMNLLPDFGERIVG